MIRQRSALADEALFPSSNYYCCVEVEPLQQQQQNHCSPSPILHFTKSIGSSPLSRSSSIKNSTGTVSYGDHRPSDVATDYRPHWRHRAEDLLWISSAIFILYYGDLRSNFFYLVANDPRVLRGPLHIGSAFLVLDLCICFYLGMRLESMKKTTEEEKVDLAAIQFVTVVGFAAFILLAAALWPIWGILTVPMLFTLVMAIVVVAPYLLPHVNLKADTDGSIIRRH